MVVGVDEPWDDELAGGVENFNLTVGLNVGRDAFDYPTVDQKIGGLGLMYVAVMVIDSAPADQIALGPGFPRHEWPLFQRPVSALALREFSPSVQLRSIVVQRSETLSAAGVGHATKETTGPAPRRRHPHRISLALAPYLQLWYEFS